MNDAPSRLPQLWEQLSPRQKKYVVARQSYRTKKAAAKAIGLTPETVYRWPDIVEEAAELYLDAAAAAAMVDIKLLVHEAVEHKAAEMRGADPVIAARAATEILDRGLGKPTQRVEQEVEGRFDVTSERIDELTDALTARAEAFDNGE